MYLKSNGNHRRFSVAIGIVGYPSFFWISSRMDLFVQNTLSFLTLLIRLTFSSDSMTSASLMAVLSMMSYRVKFPLLAITVLM